MIILLLYFNVVLYPLIKFKSPADDKIKIVANNKTISKINMTYYAEKYSYMLSDDRD